MFTPALEAISGWKRLQALRGKHFFGREQNAGLGGGCWLAGLARRRARPLAVARDVKPVRLVQSLD
jgi:hypothetical protein